MTKITTCILIVIIFVATECREAGKQQNKSLVMILCDFSGSIDTGLARRSMLTNISSIGKELPDNCVIKAYAVNSANTNPPFWRDSIKSVNSTEETEITTHNIDRRRTMLHLYKAVEAGFEQYKDYGSCILRSIDALVEEVNEASRVKQYRRVYLIVLSDLMETCRYGGTRIDFKDKIRPAAKWLDNYQPRSRLTISLEQFKIGVFVSSSRTSGTNEWKDFWDKYFKKIGYTTEMNYVADYPDGWFN